MLNVSAIPVLCISLRNNIFDIFKIDILSDEDIKYYGFWKVFHKTKHFWTIMVTIPVKINIFNLNN